MEIKALVGNKRLVADFAVVTCLILVCRQVPSQFFLGIEPLSAEPTLTRLYARVSPIVRLPVSFQSKRLVAVGALIVPFPVMYLLVQHETPKRWVGLPAFPAAVWLFSSVCMLVRFKVRYFVEPFSTFVAVDLLLGNCWLTWCSVALLSPRAEAGVVCCRNRVWG